MAAELRPPNRELGPASTLELLRRMRKEETGFITSDIAAAQELAEVSSPLSFKRGEVLFSRGEPCTWLGLLLAGRCDALLPTAGGTGGGGKGEQRMGEMLGLARVALWEKSHARAYTLRAVDDGCIAVLSYDQLEGLRRARPAFHHSLLKALLLQLADACGCFFRGCPVSNRPQFSLAPMNEPQILDFLLRLREEGTLLPNADYNCLLSLACRLRIAQWPARSSVLSKGEPLSRSTTSKREQRTTDVSNQVRRRQRGGALILLDGKMTGFREAAGAPSVFFAPGDCVGLEFLLGGVQACPLDVFAARACLAAVLRRDDLEDLRRENPSMATQILQAFHAKLFGELCGQQPPALLVMAEATERLRFASTQRPAFPAPLRFPGHLPPDEAKHALTPGECEGGAALKGGACCRRRKSRGKEIARFGWLVGSLVACLLPWLLGWLLACLLAWLVGWLVGCLYFCSPVFGPLFCGGVDLEQG
ncbi:unnamed protein product [Durusdinium trenchii]|uniref:Cyclic nucleotide-binding domain-containing protein n=1 Tax=Durusdinium trenchii TaxID=1381693 RepID=A0ABP0MJB2_9DINO